MQLINKETIVAPATASGRASIGVVRLSGPLVKDFAQHILKFSPKPRHAHFTAFYDANDQIIDEGIALYFPAPHSFTGEDVLELQGHGGPVVIDLLLQRVLELGARLARPGEFSERAFLNDKLDLAQAEAIADLINASTAQAARSAVRSLQGDFSKKIHQLVDALIHLRMYVEAAIDFPEEEIDFLSDGKVASELTSIIEKLQLIINAAKQGSLLREGLQVVIAGKPNAGKSSLLNALSEKEIAIVTDVPGTTRDVLRNQIQIDGIPLHIVDTAGLRATTDKIELEGIKRAEAELKQADIILLVEDSSENTHKGNAIFPNELNAINVPVIEIKNKIDLNHTEPFCEIQDKHYKVGLSAKTGQGIELLKHAIKSVLGYSSNEENFIARRRHLDALQRALQHLMQGQHQFQSRAAGDILAEECRLAQHALNEITGEFRSDDLLGQIFSSFCIGK